MSKRLTDNYWPEKSDNPAGPIWGFPARMLRHGYGWDGEEGFVSPRHIPKKEKGIYPPNPRVTNFQFTSRIVFYMARAGWSREQIHRELLKPDNAGGGFYRFKYQTGDSDRVLDLWLSNLFTPDQTKEWMENQKALASASRIDLRYLSKALRTSQSSTTSPGKVVEDSSDVWFVDDSDQRRPFTYRITVARKVLFAVKSSQPISLSGLKKKPPVHVRVMERYLNALIELGVVVMSKERLGAADGKSYISNVHRIAFYDTIEKALALSDLTTAERALWETALPVVLPKSAPMNLDLDFLGTIRTRNNEDPTFDATGQRRRTLAL